MPIANTNTKDTSVEIKLTKPQTLKTTENNKPPPVTRNNSIKKFLPKKINWAKDLAKTRKLKNKSEILKEKFEDTPFDLLVWEKINKVIFYPSILNYFLIEGNVRAKISINPNGTMHGYPKVQRKNNKHLEQFIFKQLKHAFKTPFDINKTGEPSRIYDYTLNFEFYISYVTGEVTNMNALKVDNKVLSFFRETYNINKSPIQKRLPFFLGGGHTMLNISGIYNKLSGNDMRKKKEKEKVLKEFYLYNSN